MKGTNDGGEAKMDKELVLYEFINLLVRIAFQRANPTYGNFGNKREVVPPPGCLEEMITNCILPNARRDTSAEFKETVMQDEAVKGVLAEYKDKLKAWYTKFCAEDTLQSDKLGMEQFLRYCNEKGVIGIWTVLQQSDINGDPNAGFEHKFKLSIPTVKTAFMDSQNQSQIGAAQASNVDEMAVLDFEPEFLECIARIGVAKYRSVKGMTPVQGIKGFIQNLIGEMDEEAVVALATYIRAERYDFATLAKPLAGQNAAAHAKWIDCWSRVEVMDMEGFPLWEEELHNLMQVTPRHHHCHLHSPTATSASHLPTPCDAASLR